MIGEKLKHQFQDNDAWILSYREECFDNISLKPSLKVPLFNGALECEFRKYQVFGGKYKDMRAKGGEIKTEDERRQMAEKKRFKVNREFKKRIDDDEDENGYRGRHFDNDRPGGRRTFDRREEGRGESRYRGKEGGGRRERGASSEREGRFERKPSRFKGDSFGRANKPYDRKNKRGRYDEED